MQVILTEPDLAEAVKLYLAHSGVIRTVVTCEFIRKLKGDDAGISVALELSDQALDPDMLAAMALEAKRVNEINRGGHTVPPEALVSVDPVLGAATSDGFEEAPESTPESAPDTVADDATAFVEDEDVPFDTETADSGPLATPEELGASPTPVTDDDDPFGLSESPDSPAEPAPAPEPAPEPAKSEPPESPFAETPASDSQVDYSPDAATATVDNPFDDAPVTPFTDDPDEPDAVPDDEPEEEALFG